MRILDRPKQVYAGLVVTIVLSFALSGVGNSGDDAANKKSDVAWIGSIGWVVFMLAVLALLVYSAFAVVRAVRRRNSA